MLQQCHASKYCLCAVCGDVFNIYIISLQLVFRARMIRLRSELEEV